ncbi:hypothetical protein [Paenibacillus glycinis]|uniref:Lipoprotein n=1 Tax=Paenibacillus glycinis TaxID=2697035 RepID=A0ABW9XUD3_9BACL|nr:hypothetical protein [Paenibacillus glycinis]NBD26263.1 hypothetical protein [Paenibacillus glycinis]
MKSLQAKQAAIAAAAVLLAIAVTGCELDYAGPAGLDAAAGDAAAQAHHPDVRSDSPQKTYDTEDGSVVPVTDNLPDAGINAANSDATAESSGGKPGKSSPPAGKAEDAWHAETPKLLGVGIGDARASAVKKLGKPNDTYALDDEDGKLTVEEYAAFALGYTAAGAVKFVEVFDKTAAAGLGGLRIGDNEADAVKKLGKPDTHTSSVLAYKAKGALLKLDLDPRNSRILSIKLFSADDQP